MNVLYNNYQTRRNHDMLARPTTLDCSSTLGNGREVGGTDDSSDAIVRRSADSDVSTDSRWPLWMERKMSWK